MKVLINDQFVDQTQATISLFSESVMFGIGLFETLRTFQNGELFRLDAHLDRLLNSASQIALELSYDKTALKKMVKKTVNAAFTGEPLRVKIMVLVGQVVIMAVPFQPDTAIYKGVRLMSYCQQRSLPHLKSTNYLDALLGYRSAQEAGFYDALLIDQNSQVYEGSRSNIFWFKDGFLGTRRGSVLPGITRDVVIEMAGRSFQFETVSLKELKAAEEVFVTNSVIGIVPVITIDSENIGDGKPGVQTQKLMARYQKQLQTLE